MLTNYLFASFFSATSILLLCNTSFSTPAENIELSAAQKTLRLACDGVATVQVMDDSGNSLGSPLHLLVNELNRLDVGLSIGFLPRKRGLINTVAGKLDGLCACFSNDAAFEALHVSKPIGKIQIGSISLRNLAGTSTNISIETLMTDAYKLGVVQVDELNNYLGIDKNRNVTPLETLEQGLKLLELRRIDAIVTIKSKYEIKRSLEQLKYNQLSYHELSKANLHFCLAGEIGGEIIRKLNSNI